MVWGRPVPSNGGEELFGGRSRGGLARVITVENGWSQSYWESRGSGGVLHVL